MSRCLPVLLLVALACLARFGSALPFDAQAELKKAQTILEELKAERRVMNERLEVAETHLKRVRDTPKVAFAASLGGNGLVKTTNGNKDLLYKDVLTNVGGAYNKETGEFTAPIRGVYYIRFTANAPTDFTMSAVLYKNDAEIQLIAHEQPSGSGSDTASNGAAFLLQKGDKLKMVLWHNTQIWDNSNHHSTFSGFLLFPMVDEPLTNLSVEDQLKDLKESLVQVQTENSGVKARLEATEKELKAIRASGISECRPADSPAKLEEDLLKHQNRTSAAEDGERLTGKQRVGHPRQRRPEQRLYGTLPEREEQATNSPPNVTTGDMQAQYRKRMEAKHCRLTASLMSLHRNGAFLRTSFTKPPKILPDTGGIQFLLEKHLIFRVLSVF